MKEIENIKKIKEIISEYSLDENTRLRTSLYPRYEFISYLRKDLKMSLPSIGKLLGKDHSTVINACNKRDNMMGYNDVEYLQKTSDIRTVIEELRKNLVQSKTRMRFLIMNLGFRHEATENNGSVSILTLIKGMIVVKLIYDYDKKIKQQVIIGGLEMELDYTDIKDLDLIINKD